MTTLVEDIQTKGDETVFRLPFVTVRGSLKTPFSQDQYASKQGQFRPPFSIRMWSLLKSGMVHKNSIVYKNATSTLFPVKRIELTTPYTEDFKRLKDLHCYQSLARIIKFGLTSNEIKFCVFDDVPDSKGNRYQVLVPCAEIARFYFFNSSNLITVALTPHSLSSDQNRLFNPQSSVSWFNEKDEEIKVVVLREDLELDDGFIVGRIAYSPTAKRSLSIIHRSLGDISTGKYIQCPFPFNEPTNLECNTMGFTHEGKNILLVMQINTCTAPLPFDELHVLREEPEKKENSDPDPGKEKEDGNDNNKRPPKKPSQDPDNNNEPEITGQPGNKNNRDKVVFSFADRFKDLKNKKIVYVDKSFQASRERHGKKEPILAKPEESDNNEQPSPRRKRYSLNRDKKTNPGTTRLSNAIKEKVFPKNAIELPSDTLKKDSILKANRFKLIYDLKKEFDSRSYETSFIKFFDVSETSDFTYLVADAESAGSVWPFLDYEKGIRRRAILLKIVADIGTFVILDYDIKGEDKSSLKYFAREDLGNLKHEDLIEVCTTLVHNYGKIATVVNGNTLKSLLTDHFIVGRNYHKEIAGQKGDPNNSDVNKKEMPLTHFASNILKTLLRLTKEKSEEKKNSSNEREK